MDCEVPDLRVKTHVMDQNDSYLVYRSNYACDLFIDLTTHAISKHDVTPPRRRHQEAARVESDKEDAESMEAPLSPGSTEASESLSWRIDCIRSRSSTSAI